MVTLEFTTVIRRGPLVRVSCVFCNSGVLENLCIFDASTDEKMVRIERSVYDGLIEDAYNVLKYREVPDFGIL